MSLPPRVMYHRSHAFESWYESAQYDNFTGEQVQPIQFNHTGVPNASENRDQLAK
jgi:hypothetical protein